VKQTALIFAVLLLSSVPIYTQGVWSPTGTQNLSVSASQLNFGTKQTNTKDSLSFRVRNSGNYPVRITDINTHKSAFSVRDTSFHIPAHDSVTVWVFFQTNQNVTWRDHLTVENSAAANGRGSLVVRLSGTGTYNELAYSSTQDLWENPLKTALAAIVNNHTNLGYNTARDRMFETIDDGGVDTIECVYTGRRIRAVTRTEAQSQSFNTEHTWPQSFFNEAEPLRADIYHLYPTDVDANSRRANYPLGPVSSNITWQQGGSKLGSHSTGEIVFEPRDVHKGDASRALFYFLLRYGNLGNFMSPIQEFDLRAWYRSDPVSAKESLRNSAIASYQGKRNPLIDHPEFLDRISYFYTSTAPVLYPDIVVSPTNASLGSVVYYDSVEYNLTMVNRGRGALSISSVTLQNGTTGYSILSFPATVPADSFGIVKVKFKPTLPVLGSYSDVVTINSNDPDQLAVAVPMNASAFLPFVDVRVMLEGPYQQATGRMATTLRSNGALAARYPGALIPADAVDSITIELRDSLSASTATTRSYRAAWLLEDGYIRDFSDTSRILSFDDIPAGAYYVVVRHGNHLAIVSSERYPLSSMPSGGYDFTWSQSSAYGVTPMKQVAIGVFAMYAGDANQSNIVSTADANAIFGSLGATGYNLLDANLSGIVSTADANVVFGNLGRASQAP
jgi:endonuclease I